MQAIERGNICVLCVYGCCMWEGQRDKPAACWVFSALGAGEGLDWLEGVSQLTLLKNDLVLNTSELSCRCVANPGALELWGGYPEP